MLLAVWPLRLWKSCGARQSGGRLNANGGTHDPNPRCNRARPRNHWPARPVILASPSERHFLDAVASQLGRELSDEDADFVRLLRASDTSVADAVYAVQCRERAKMLMRSRGR